MVVVRPAVVLLAGVALAACGGGAGAQRPAPSSVGLLVTTSAAGGSSSAAAASAAELTTRLLTVADLPAGWTQQPDEPSSTPSPPSRQPGCSTTSPPDTFAARATRDFVSGSGSGSGVSVEQELDSYPTAEAAAAAFDAIVAYIRGCRTFDDAGVLQTVAPLTLAGTVGDQETAFQVTGSSQGYDYAYDEVYARAGAVVCIEWHASGVPIDSRFSSDLEATAVQRLSS